MKRLMVLLSALLITGITHAQGLLPPLLVLYQAEDGAVMVYIEQTDEHRVLISAEDVPADAYVKASFAGAGMVSVQVMAVHNGRPYPADYNGKTIGELGLQNMLYMFELGEWRTIVERPLLPDDFVIDFFMPGAEQGYLYDPLLEANFGVELSGRWHFIWVEGADDFADEYAVNGFGRLVIYDDLDQTVTTLDPLPGTPVQMMWSRDGRYGLFRAITNFGTGAGYSSAGTYLLDTDDMSLEQITPCCRDIMPYGWLNSGEFIYSEFSLLAGAAGLFVYDPQTATTRTLLPVEQNNIDAFATDIQPESGQILVTISDFSTSSESAVLQAGTYLYRSLDASPERIYNLATGQPADRAAFVSPDTVFVANANPRYAGTYKISTGELLPEELIEGYAYLSPYGVIFSQREGGALMLTPVLEGGMQVFIPGLIPEYVQWLDPATFIAFTPHRYGNTSGSDHVIVVERTSGTFKSVALGAGHHAVAATWDLRMR